jgi:hypothetical protein
MSACSGAPATPGAISGSITVCSGSNQTYSIAAVTGATSYTWTLPGGWTGSSSTNSISVTVGATSGSVSVVAGNACGTSAAQNLSVTVNSAPATPGVISGSITICSGSSNTYSVAAVAGATAYTWTLPVGWTGSSTSNIINTTASANSGNVTVSAVNACGTSAAQTKSVTVVTAPATPGVISGNATVCPSSSNTYSVAAVAGATAYTWTLPVGWTGSSTSNIINTTASANSGNITVTAVNACGTSAPQTKSVTVVTTPATPGAISGSVTVCAGSNQTYSIAAVTGATSYTWTLPGGWTGSSSTNIISVTVGAGSGSVSVVAGNACGTSAAANLSVTVNSAPATPGTISGSITICSGSSNTYSIAAVAGATAYVWTLPAGWSGSSATNIINTTASANSGNITVTAVNACGTSAPQTKSVTVGTAPAMPGSISGPISKCVGSGASNYSVAAVASATAYTWSLPAGWSGSSITNIISATPGSSGIFTVVATNSCGTSPMQTLSVTINPLPIISVNSGSICSGKSFTIIPGGASTYTIQGGSFTVSPGSTTSYTVSGTSTAGCVSASSATSTVTVSATPTITVNSGSICSGNSFTIVPGGASTYTIQGGSAVVNPGATTSYTVIGTSTAGCVSASFATSNVTVNTTPTVSMASGTICPGGSFTLSGSGANTYTYSSGPVVSPVITTTYSVIGSSTAGCTSSSASAVVTVTNNLNVSITGASTVCSGQSLNLAAIGASTYTWNTNATTSSIAPTPTANTTYSVIGASGSCSNTAMINVTVNPTPSVTASTNNSIICFGQVAVLTASGAVNYSWTPGSGTGSSINVSPTVTTTYTITGDNGNGCSSSATITQTAVDCTGSSEVGLMNSDITIYPNPTSGRITLSISTSLNMNSVEGQPIFIYNILGTLIHTELNTATENCTLDLSLHPNGIYIIKIGTLTKKIIKE